MDTRSTHIELFRRGGLAEEVIRRDFTAGLGNDFLHAVAIGDPQTRAIAPHRLETSVDAACELGGRNAPSGQPGVERHEKQKCTATVQSQEAICTTLVYDIFAPMHQKGGMSNILKRLRKKKGLTLEQLAALANTSHQQIGKLEKGEREMTRTWAERIAPHLDASPVDLVFPERNGEDRLAVDGVVYGGLVEAGAFREVDMLNQDAPRTVPVPRDPLYPHCRQYAFEVRGDSMNLARIEEGMWVVAVNYEDFHKWHGDVRDGMKVVVLRVRAQGAERELTVKEVRLYRDRMELLPRSSNPDHKPLVISREEKPIDEDVERVDILAIVTNAVWSFRYD
jgi:transcriptional regulator with XRE-family HTH domain